MKTSCPACGQHLEYGEDFAGTTAPCPKCGAEVSFPNLRVCPDCGAEVSRRAEVCPRCAAPLTAAAPAAAPVSTAPGKVTEEYQFVIFATLIFIAGVLLTIPALQMLKIWGFVVPVLALFGASACWERRFELKCSCGCRERPKVTGDAGCLTALFLLCLFVIPGIIYLAVMSHPRFYCPKCGREGFK